MQEKLIEQERKLVTSQIAGTAAHQLGQPISAILLNCSFLESAAKTDPKAAKAVQAIKSDIKRMSELIERLRVIDPKKVEGYYEGMEILDIDED